MSNMSKDEQTQEKNEAEEYARQAREKRLRVCSYVRISTDKNDQKSSFKVQVQYFEREMAKCPNWINVGIFKDEGKSGTSREKRDDFNRMIEKAKAGEIDLIITKELSRFSRNLLDTVSILEDLRKLNVDVWFLANGLRAGRTADYQTICEHATRAQGESLMTSARVKWGQQQSMEMGVVFGRREMFGYNIVKDDYGFQHFEIIEEEAEIIRNIFAWFAAGDGTHVIARRLEQMGIKTKRYKNGWTNTVILRLLRNDKYIGHLTQGKTWTPEPLDHKKKYNRDPNKLIVIENHHTPIVDQETWDIVQQRLKEKEPSDEVKAKHSNRYWTSGKVYCGLCGGRYVSYQKKQQTVPYRAWVCFENHQRGKYKKVTLDNGETTFVGCNALRVNDRVLTEMLKDIVTEYLARHKDTLLAALTDEITKLKQPKDHAKEIQAKQRELESKNRLLLELTLKYNANLIPDIAYKMAAESYKTDIEDLIQQIDALQMDAPDNRAISHLEWCKKELERVLDLDHTKLNEILYGSITKRIVVSPLNVIEIHLSFLTAPIRMQYKTSGKGTFYKVESTILDQSEFEELMKAAPRNEIQEAPEQ